MHVIVIGNGLCGTIFAKTLRDIDADIEIDIFGQEQYLYYPRPNLIEFLAGHMPYDRLFAFSEAWYSDHNIRLHLAQKVEKIDPAAKTVEFKNRGVKKYDKLLLAHGAYAGVPPIKNVNKSGVFTLRTLEDALNIQAYLKDRKKVVVIGGGLLGLEIARALKAGGAEVAVVEFFPRLLPRQLDTQAATLLKRQIENMGIQVLLDKTTEEVLGGGEATGLRFKDGGEIAADMIVVAAGVRPYLDLAQESGLETDRGVIVNAYLQTSHPDIYAAGDVSEHKGRVHGIIPASFQQARTAAYNISGQVQEYEGTVPSNTLKVMGVHVTSLGLVNPEEEGYEEIFKLDAAQGCYKKVVLQNGALVGAIWMGSKEGINEINRLVAQNAKIGGHKADILEDSFDLSRLIK
ncbi:MAG: NAD(P)/FAD-dependent oxidoreductase [Candidatus Aminicenantes bacterium]|nr:NAD(P)/FAD-dependent oxidoreductase [Candidatus Aminicenantes bacterium]